MSLFHRYPGTTFLDHMLRYEQNPEIKIIVMLGEVGGTEEYVVGRMCKEGSISKPVVAWCIGTCATMFNSDVQFGHAGMQHLIKSFTGPAVMIAQFSQELLLTTRVKQQLRRTSFSQKWGVGFQRASTQLELN